MPTGYEQEEMHPELLAQSEVLLTSLELEGWLDEQHEFFYMNDEGDESNAVAAGQPSCRADGTRPRR